MPVVDDTFVALVSLGSKKYWSVSPHPLAIKSSGRTTSSPTERAKLAMFSPATVNSTPAANTRNARRRPRPASSENIALQPKAKRQRSSLHDNTFVAPDAASEMQEVKAKKPSVGVARHESITEPQGTIRRDLTVRGKKPKSVERSGKGDGSTVLTSNDVYTVSRLPALPDRLQSTTTGRQHGAIYSDSGYALAFTTTHALVWPYALNTTNPETFTFALPYPAKHTSEHLPLGSLVSASASTPEPGLVVVMPSSGKITYWESIASAATLDLIQQQRNGVELTIPGLLHGEVVIQILNAESAGFLLSFSSGRLAYMSVRDGQGRPAVSVQFLRGTSGAGNGGIFGSIRNALSSSSWRGDLAAARAGPSLKPGERDIVSASSKGRLQAWCLHRGGHNTLEAEGDTRELIVDEIKRSDSSLANLDLESFEVLDFSFAPQVGDRKDSAALTYRDDNGTELLMLTSLGGHGVCHYTLVQVFLSQEGVKVGTVHHLRSYSTPVSRTSTSKPRLYLPKPSVAAFVVFDRAVVVTSMAKEPDSPDQQLGMGIKYFEDVVDFRTDAGVEITGSGMEEPHTPSHGAEDNRSRRHKAKFPAVVLLVKGGGIIRIATTDPDKFTAGETPQVTAKSKLDQAVFFGILENNPLSFSGRPEIQFSTEEVGQAALQLSHEVLSSTTTHIPSIPASIEQNLRLRAQALHSLATHIKKMNVELDRLTKWKLLWDAEKLNGAKGAWSNYDNLISSKPAGQKRSLWNDIVECLHEEYKLMPSKEFGEVDRVRHYFVHDIHRFQMVVPWAFQAVKVRYEESELGQSKILELVSEANDLLIGALEGAYTFRTENLALYGLQGEDVQNGILMKNYKNIPEPWTCQLYVADNAKRQTDLAIGMVRKFWPISTGENQPDPDLVDKVRLECPEMLDLACRSTTEKYRWYLDQDDKKKHNQGLQMQHAYFKVRESQIYNLSEIGLVDEGIELAEKHRVFDTLVPLIVEEIQRTNETIAETEATPGGDPIGLKARVARLQAQVEGYYDLFGMEWAKALYSYYIKEGELFALLSDNDSHQKYLTAFLRSKKEYAKVSWINEVTQEKDYHRASAELLDLGLHRERDLWSKKVQLSIGKLARLAGRNAANGLVLPDGEEMRETEAQLEIIRIQGLVHKHVRSAIKGAIDDTAERQLALEVYDNPSLHGKAALATVLHEKLGWLLDHKAMGALDLVDLLTLLGPDSRGEGGGVLGGEEFHHALLALNAAGPTEAEEFRLAEQGVWRRCLLRDDWGAINDTDAKSDEEVRWRLEGTALYKTLRGCVRDRLFESPSRLRVVTPSSLASGPATTLDARYRSLDAGVRAPLLSDLSSEDNTLKSYITHARLGKWFEGALDLAKRSVEDEKKEKEEGERGLQEVAERLKEIEAEIEERERGVAREMLRCRPRGGRV
ncbi:hypothetical protein V496_04035 [Pseudogymnoascus sp. VKM F-4515 (FW-2607)]|nr:hypothetical protein V496_04035 [Pseudogymnoascus sp. VKM F-4515 (FW-2607)]